MVVLAVIAGVFLLLTIWLALGLHGVIQHVEDLERRLEVVVSAMPGKVKRTGLPIGSEVPAFEAPTLEGQLVSSAAFAGHEHLILFAHPGCPPCEEVVPQVFEEAEWGKLPPTLVVSEQALDHPRDWTQRVKRSDRIQLLVQGRSAIARRFETFITPHMFVVGADGRVQAQGITGSLADVGALIKAAHRYEAGLAATGSERSQS